MVALAVVALCGCGSDIQASDGSAASGQSGGSGGGSGTGTGTGSGGGPDPGTLENGVPYTTRVARLTHAQYDNTVADLLHLDGVEASSEFQPDPVFGGYDNSVDDLTVADRLGRDYRRAAEALAANAVNDAGAYDALVPCTPGDAGCAEAFVREFGRRAYRRPLTVEEQALYVTLHGAGAELLASGDAFRDGVQVVIEAMLQSPKFLYRTELTAEAEPDGFLRLSDYEVAQRLSYMLWNSMPDEALFDAAEGGGLTLLENVATEASRLLASARAEAPVADFHSQWLDLGRYADLTRSAELFPDFSPGLPMQEETLEFVRHVAFDLELGYETMMTAPFTFVDTGLARLYGLSGDFGAELQKVDLDASQRGGLLTQIGFLASHAYPTETSPIHRGVFVHRRILCNDIPDPPPNIDTTQGRVDDASTTREAIEIQTSQPACTTCHSLINPPGFAFEQYDAVGAYRTTDDGNPLDTTGEVLIDAELVAFQGPIEMIGAIARSHAARHCYAENLLRYAYGRREAPSDAATLEELAAATASDDFGVKDMLLALSQTRAFRLRAPNLD
jgi:hypothetical protein